MAISKDGHRVSARVPDHVYRTLIQAADLMDATINQFPVNISPKDPEDLCNH